MACSKEVSKDVVRLLLVGKTGSGKSSSANMILGKSVCNTSEDCCSDTSECTKNTTQVGDIIVEVMDTPGLFDTSKEHEEVGLIIVKCVIELHPGPDAVFVVFRIGTRYTDEDFAAYRRLKVLFGANVTKHMIVLFTGGDQLSKKGKKIDEFLRKAPKNLLAVLTECQWRYSVLDNEMLFEDGRDQVQLLLSKVRELKDKNENKPYVCNNYRRIGKTLEDTEALKKEISVKLRELEAQEAKALKVIQEYEAEHKAKLDQLNLDKDNYDKEMKKMKEKMEKDFQDQMSKWDEKKAAEEEELIKKKKAQEEQMQKEKEEHDKKLNEEKLEIRKEMAEEQRLHEKRMKEDQDAHTRRLEEQNATWKKQQEELISLKEKEHAHQKAMAVLNTVTEVAKAVVNLAGHKQQQPNIEIHNVLPYEAEEIMSDSKPDDEGTSVD